MNKILCLIIQGREKHEEIEKKLFNRDEQAIKDTHRKRRSIRENSQSRQLPNTLNDKGW